MTNPPKWPTLEFTPIVISILTCAWYTLQVTGGTSAAGKAHQIRSTCFHLPSFWRVDSLCNVFFQPLLAECDCWMLQWMVSQFRDQFYFYGFVNFCGVFNVCLLSWHGRVLWLRTGVVGPFSMLCHVLNPVSCAQVLWLLHGWDASQFPYCACWMFV